MPYIKGKLATTISIASPKAFKQSVIRLASRDGLDNVERRAIRGAREEARIKSYSKLIPERERRNLREIANMKF